MINHCFQPRKKEIGYFSIFQKTKNEEMIELMFFKHLRMQKDNIRYNKNKFINVSK